MTTQIPLTQEHIDKGRPGAHLHCAMSRAINAHPDFKNASVVCEYYISSGGPWTSGEATLTIKETGKRITAKLYSCAEDFMHNFDTNKKLCNDGLLHLDINENEENWLVYEENLTNEPIQPYSIQN